MLMLPPAVRVFVCAQATDMRRSFDKLAEMTRTVLDQDPFSGHLFVFVNRPRDRVKLLYWDRSGFCLFYKRLEQGTFQFSSDGAHAEIDAAELALILEGIEVSSVRRQKRYNRR